MFMVVDTNDPSKLKRSVPASVSVTPIRTGYTFGLFLESTLCVLSGRESVLASLTCCEYISRRTSINARMSVVLEEAEKLRLCEVTGASLGTKEIASK